MPYTDADYERDAAEEGRLKHRVKILIVVLVLLSVAIVVAVAFLQNRQDGVVTVRLEITDGTQTLAEQSVSAQTEDLEGILLAVADALQLKLTDGKVTGLTIGGKTWTAADVYASSVAAAAESLTAKNGTVCYRYEKGNASLPVANDMTVVLLVK